MENVRLTHWANVIWRKCRHSDSLSSSGDKFYFEGFAVRVNVYHGANITALEMIFF